MGIGRVMVLAGLAAGAAALIGAGRQTATAPNSWERPVVGQGVQLSFERLQQVSTELRLRKIDQGFADIGPLGTSFREVPPDLHAPDGFRDVYQIPENVNSPYAGWFARFQGNGALVAVFPQSEYQAVKKGIQPEVTTATRFLIGGLNLGAAESAARPEGWLSLRLDTKLATLMPELMSQTRGADRSIDLPAEVVRQQQRQREAELMERVKRMFEDEGFRAERVGRLVRR